MRIGWTVEKNNLSRSFSTFPAVDNCKKSRARQNRKASQNLLKGCLCRDSFIGDRNEKSFPDLKTESNQWSVRTKITNKVIEKTIRTPNIRRFPCGDEAKTSRVEMNPGFDKTAKPRAAKPVNIVIRGKYGEKFGLCGFMINNPI
jgi:hypothetical protein